jgi:hypothetical protein
MNLLNGGYKIIGLVKKIRHLFNDVGLNNFSILRNVTLIYEKIIMIMPGKFPVVFFLLLKFIHLGSMKFIMVTLKTYLIRGLFLLGIEKLF